MGTAKQKKIKITIVVLSVLLGISISFLTGMVIYKNLNKNREVTVFVPDNLITENKENIAGFENYSSSGDLPYNGKSAVLIELNARQPQENTAFSVQNMFPGDECKKFFRVDVSYQGRVTIGFKSEISELSEKLADVMKIRILSAVSGETLYDGLMRDFSGVLQKLSAKSTKTDELFYEITAYLDVWVGNEYQNEELSADFIWWVEETDNLEPPKTGDDLKISIFAVIAFVLSAVLTILLFICKKEGEEKI